MYTIKAAAEMVGVSDSTLRAWERRHGLDVSRRTPSGYRLYDDTAVEVLRTMRDLLGEGWNAREAADEALRRAFHTPLPPGPFGPPDERDLVDIAVHYDADALTALLDHRFGEADFETVVDTWLLPALHALGMAWDHGEITVAGEHLVSHGVGRRLSREYDATPAPEQGSPRVVIGLPPGARHDLGLLCFATAARRAGLDTTYLSSDVPTDAWAEAVASPVVRCAALAAPRTADIDSLERTVQALRARRPDLVIAVGGSAQEHAPEDCVVLGHQVGAAATDLAERLRDQQLVTTSSPQE